MKPPPLLLGATVLFWGWQTDFLIVSIVMAVLLEGSRLVRTRWDFTDEDFSRIWTLCSLVLLAMLVYAFTANEGPTTFSSFFQNPTPGTQTDAGASSAQTLMQTFRWLPMIFFPFVAAQMYSTRDSIPLSTISLLLRRRKKKAQQAGKTVPAGASFHAGHGYFATCLASSCFHPAENMTFFWGVAALLGWELWTQRSRRFAAPVWAGAFVVAVALGFIGQRSVSQLQYLERFNPWLARLLMRPGFGFDPTQSKTALGTVGELKTSHAIVVRLETKKGVAPPAYLRQASYRGYRTPIWFAGTSKDDFNNVSESPANSGIWPLLQDKTNFYAVNIACYLAGSKSNTPSGLLAAPSGSFRLERLPAYILETNSAGAILAQGPGLVIFDALYGPGRSIDSPPDTSSLKEDLAVDEKEIPAIDRVIDELGLRGKTRDEAKQIISSYFTTNFTYSTWQGRVRMRGLTNQTPLSRFLLQTRSGHCEYFATATALMLRRLEIPARYAVGFAIHEGSGTKYVARMSDAHAWCLVWNEEEKIWEDFDTTPGSWVEEERKRASAFQWLSDAWGRVKFEISKFRWGQSRFRQYILWITAPALVLLLYQIIFRSGRRRRKAEKSDGEIFDLPGIDSEFYQLERKISQRGVPRQASETASAWLKRIVEDPEFVDLREPLQQLLRLHYRYRFDPLGLSEADRGLLKREARECLEKLSGSNRIPATADA